MRCQRRRYPYVRSSRGWQRYGCVVASVCGISWVGLFVGCEKAGGGGGQQTTGGTPTPTPQPTPQPTPTPPPSPPTPPTPPAPPVVGITLTAGATALLADGVSSTTITAELITARGDAAASGTVVTFSTDKGRFNVAGAKTVTATTSGDSGIVVVPFISERS